MNQTRKQRMIREAWGPDYPNAVTAVGLVRIGMVLAILGVAAATTDDIGPNAATVQVAQVEVVR